MQTLKKSLIMLLILSFGIQAIALEEKPSLPRRVANSIYDHRSEIADATLALSAVWLGVTAIGTYRLSRIPEKALPNFIHTLLNSIQPIITIDEAIQLELTGLACAGGSLSALALLMLKKLSWEKKQTTKEFN